MRNAVNVPVAILSLLVCLAASLQVIPDRHSATQDPAFFGNRLHEEAEGDVEAEDALPTAAHRAAALLQWRDNALQDQRQARLAKVDAAFQVALEQVLVMDEEDRHQARLAKVDVAFQVGLKDALALEEASLRKVAAAAKVRAHAVPKPASRLPVAPASQASRSLPDNVASRAAEGHDHLSLSDILGNLAVSNLLGGMHVQGSIPGPSPPTPSSFGKRIDAWRLAFVVSHHSALRYAMNGFMSVLVWAVLILLLGVFYHHGKLHPPKLDPEGVNVSLHDRERLDRRRWRFGLCECMEVPSLCLFSFCCAPLRWADTMRMAGFLNFFAALAIAVGLAVLGSFSLGMGFFALVGVCVHYRRRMRAKYDIHSHFCGSSSELTDVLAYLFCPWCSIVQEARQMEEAYLARHASVQKEKAIFRLV